MLHRLAVYVVPTAAVATVAFVLLGPGARRAAVGVRVHGVAADGTSVLALRLVGVQRLSGVDDAVPVDGLTVTASAGAQALPPWSGATDADGVAEARLEAAAPLHGPVDLVVKRGEVVLAEGRIALTRTARHSFQLATLRGAQRGELFIRVDALRGVFAAPFADGADVQVLLPGGGPVGAGIEVKAELTGGNVTPKSARTDARGMVRLLIEPLAQTVDLAIDAAGPKSVEGSAEQGKTGHWEGALPVGTGTIWLDAARWDGERALRLVAPTKRSAAYLSVYGENGRVFGAVVPLAQDERGLFGGSVTLPELRQPRLLYAVVAADPLEQGAGTAAWPVTPPSGGPTAVPLQTLLDGLPAADRRESARVVRARRGGMLVLGVAMLLEVALLMFGARASRRRLETHLDRVLAAPEADGEPAAMGKAERASVVAGSSDSAVYRTVAYASLIILAFSIIAALASLR
ncbi:MAG: hypothetical protein WKG00_04800 [Polyangiaceae bacterium]